MSGVRRFAPEVVSPLMPLRTHADLQVEQNRMKLPAMDELLRIIAAARCNAVGCGVTTPAF